MTQGQRPPARPAGRGGLEHMWSPWRSEYISSTAGEGDGGCLFCDHLAAGDDEATGILHRGKSVFVLMNAYPYNTGHLMIAPNRHVGELEDLTSKERTEMMDLSAESVRIIRDAMKAHGFNLGINLGAVAGAGVPGHIHLHVVPRWGGDTNFMPVVANTKVLPEMLADTARKLRPGFEALGRAH